MCDPLIFWVVLIWPLVSVAFGLIAGAISGTISTLIVFLIALFHFPLHLWKTLSVAATTDECFTGIPGNLIWRLPVLLLAPIGPILFLLGWTILSATFGTLSQIWTATGIAYNIGYEKAAEKTRSNLRLEDDSKLGKFLVKCKKVAIDDDVAITTCVCIKTLLTTAIAFCFACLAFIPLAVTLVAITLFRLPINFFKTMKITLFTVMLRWDLRIIMLLMLPLIHTVFAVVVLVVSIVGCFLWTWVQTQESLFKDKNPFREWGRQFIDVVKDYYEEHKKFASERCDPFDHPTGIPMGWNGQQYGLEFERIVRLQLNFLLCVTLMLYQTPIILVAATVIVLVKYIMVCVHLWKEYFTFCCCDGDSSLFLALIFWPFHVLAVILVPLGAALYGVGFIVYPILASYGHVAQLIFFSDAPLCVCLSVPFIQIRRCDAHTSKQYLYKEHFRFVTTRCCPCSKISGYENDHESSGWQDSSPSFRRETLNADVYWDRFASQCIQSTADLLANGFLDYDSVEGMDPSCVQSIPSVAVLAILMDTLKKEGLKKGDIYWKVGETVCAQKGRAPLDNIAALLWPMVLDIQDFLKKHKKELVEQEDEQALAMEALLCDNHETDQSTGAIRKVLERTSEKQRALNNQLRTKIARLVLAILRVRPFQERMEKIFEYKYGNANKTMDDLEAQPFDDKLSAGTISEEVESDPNSKVTPDVPKQPVDDKLSEDTISEEVESDPNSKVTPDVPKQPVDGKMPADTISEEAESDPKSESDVVKQPAGDKLPADTISEEAESDPNSEETDVVQERPSSFFPIIYEYD